MDPRLCCRVVCETIVVVVGGDDGVAVLSLPSSLSLTVSGETICALHTVVQQRWWLLCNNDGGQGST